MRIKGVLNSVKCGNLQMFQPHYKLSTFLSMQKGRVSICDQLTSAIYLLQVCLSHHHLFCKLLPIKTTGSIETKVDKDGP